MAGEEEGKEGEEREEEEGREGEKKEEEEGKENGESNSKFERIAAFHEGFKGIENNFT